MEDIIEYIKQPNYCKIQKFDYRVLIKLIILNLIFGFACGSLSFFLGMIFSIEDKGFVSDIVWDSVVYGAVIAPVLEEFICRYFLRPTNKNRIIYIMGVFLLAVFFVLEEGFIPFCFFVALLGICFLVYLKFKQSKINFYRWYIKYFKFIFYMSALVFGLLHIANFNFSGYAILVMPFMVLPQMFGGLLLGFMRMKYGIAYSVLLHMLFNTILFIIVLT